MKIEIVQNSKQGLETAKRLIYKIVESKTALFLSGGTTPKPLYKSLAKEKKLHVGAIAMVDERFGQPNHHSNERMIRETGFIDYLSAKNVPFYSILGQSLGVKQRRPGGVNRERRHLEGVSIIAKEYDRKVKGLLSSFPKSVAIMGIGEDGHIAGLPEKSQISSGDRLIKSQTYVIGIDDFPGEFKERITLTFNALSKMDLLIVLVFGSAKKTALSLMFAKGAEEIPARFYTKPTISEKTILITDQKV